MDINETQIENTCCQETIKPEYRTFEAGKIVKLGGFPVRCTSEVTIEAHPETWLLIDGWEAGRSERVQAGCCEQQPTLPPSNGE